MSEDITQKLARVVAHTILEALKPIKARLDVLESRPELTYLGVFKEGHTYGSGALVTRSGGLWLAEEHTDGTPGTEGASGWRLIVKSGGAAR